MPRKEPSSHDVSDWHDIHAQQVIRYEALFVLVEDIQGLTDISKIAQLVTKQWKYFANVASWHLILSDENGFLVIDGFRGQATLHQLAAEKDLSPWDQFHWKQRRPTLIPIVTINQEVPPPEHLVSKRIYEIQVLPIMSGEKCIGILNVSSLHEPFTEIDNKYMRLLGNYFADRVSSLLLQKRVLRELKEAQKELVEKAHQSGMADIATGVLHNVGNLLNSVKSSIEAIEGVLVGSPVDGLSKANKLLGEHMDRLEEFIRNDPRGKNLLRYFIKIEAPIQNAFNQIRQDVKRVIERINIIDDVIAAQQSYAGVGGLSEKAGLADIIEDTLTMQSGTFERHKIRLIRDYSEVPEILVQKTKLIHIIVNLVKNAKDAMVAVAPENKVLTLAITRDDRAIFVRVTDSGCGIPPENITKIFSHGFTTKNGGHGFGLHSCANYMKEMGGEMWAESEGLGKGASFVLQFNIHQENTSS